MRIPIAQQDAHRQAPSSTVTPAIVDIPVARAQ